MYRRTKALFAVSIPLSFVLAALAGGVYHYVRTPVWRTSGAMLADLRQVTLGVQTLSNGLHAAEELVRIDPTTRAARIECLRERAAYEKALSRQVAKGLDTSGESIAPLADLSRLLAQMEELLDRAVEGSPSRVVGPEESAAAPVLETDANRAGVLPGVGRLVDTRAARIREEAEALAQKTEELVLGSQLYVAQFAGLSDRQWFIILCCGAVFLSVLASATALLALRPAPEALVEQSIRNVSRKAPRNGVDLCYKHIDHLLKLADHLTREIGA